MIKLSKAYVLMLVALTLPAMACAATAAFSFSVPSLSITAGPGLGGGPTVFNTYSHDVTTIGSGAAVGAAANAGAAPSYGEYWGGTPGWIPPLGPACPAIPGYGGFGDVLPYGLGSFFGPTAIGAYPFSADQAFNQEFGSQALEDNTFATSFYTEGLSPFSGLCNAAISGNAPQQFTLQFF